MSNRKQPSYIFSHLKRSSNGESISFSFQDLLTADTTLASDSSISSPSQIRIVFSAKAHTRYGSELFICGSLKELGRWNPSFALPLRTTPETYPIWTSSPISLQMQALPLSFEYKFIIMNPTSSLVVWEGFHNNRSVIIQEKCTFWTVFKVFQEFGVYSWAEFVLESRNSVIKRMKNLAKGSICEVLEDLQSIIEFEDMNNDLVLAVGQVLKGLNYRSQEGFELISRFFEKCLGKVTQSDMKTMLNGVHVAELQLKNSSESFISKADNYQNSNENFDEEFIQAFKLSDLRKSIFVESKNQENSVCLLLTDNNFEKKEIDLLETVVENIEEKSSVWKISHVGKWICEMLFYNLIRMKQVKILINQFERLEKKENLEVLRDLLYEMMELVFEEYCERMQKTNHFDLEAISKSFGIEYSMIYYDIFLLASKFIIKTVAIINKCLLRTSYLCYSAGNCTGKLRSYTPDYPNWKEKHILILNKPDEYLSLNETTTGIIVTQTSNMLLPILVEANLHKIPVAIGFNPSYESMQIDSPTLNSEEHSLMLTEDYCWLTSHNSLQ